MGDLVRVPKWVLGILSALSLLWVTWVSGSIVTTIVMQATMDADIKQQALLVKQTSENVHATTKLLTQHLINDK